VHIDVHVHMHCMAHTHMCFHCTCVCVVICMPMAGLSLWLLCAPLCKPSEEKGRMESWPEGGQPAM
jgi:hypothetical protein